MSGMASCMRVANAGRYRLTHAAKSARPVQILILEIFSPWNWVLFESFNVL
jgi:hypothetical protein